MNMISTLYRGCSRIVCLAALAAAPAFAQEPDVIEFFPEDAAGLPSTLNTLQDLIIRLAPGVYDMTNQLRFNPGQNLVIEGSGSGFGPEATVLDFHSFSMSALGDGRALSIRGAVTVRNLTIVNVIDRATDLRTGTIENPSNEAVEFENVWFIDCNLGLKSTGGRTVGSPEQPMRVKHCVFAVSPDYPFDSYNDAVDIRDTCYIEFDHCDFFNTPLLMQFTINDPAAAPNIGPQVAVKNSIFLATNGPEEDLDIQAGKLTILNSVLWDQAGESGLQRTIEETIVEENTRTGDPLYVNVMANTPAAELDFNVAANSPASGLGDDGRNAGSAAQEPVRVEHWMLQR